MITFKAIVIRNNRRKDGTYPVKIRVTFKGVSRRLPTTLVALQSDLTRTLHIKSTSILNRCDELIGRMRTAISDVTLFDLEDRDVDWVVDRIKDRMTRESFRLDFFEWGDKFALTKSESTRRAYTGALNAFERFLGKRSVDINDITKSMLLDFMEYIDNEKKIHYDHKTGKFVESGKKKVNKGASSRHLMKLQHIYQSAKDKYNDEDAGRIVIPRTPFSSIEKTFPPSQGQRNLGEELMQYIIKAQADSVCERIALDAFIVSFGLMGANLADMYNAVPFSGDWVYNRIKTMTRRADRAEMRVTVPPELRPYIARLQEGKGEWWLPVLHSFAGDQNKCTQRVNKYLKKWCEKVGIEPFTFYAGRHTFASLCRKQGVDKSTVDDCLCHKGDYDLTDTYAEKAWGVIQEANRKVIDLFEW